MFNGSNASAAYNQWLHRPDFNLPQPGIMPCKPYTDSATLYLRAMDNVQLLTSHHAAVFSTPGLLAARTPPSSSTPESSQSATTSSE